MNPRLSKYSLSSADIRAATGHDTADMACRQCAGCFCDHKAAKIIDGKPLILCTLRPETQAALEWAARHQGEKAPAAWGTAAGAQGGTV